MWASSSVSVLGWRRSSRRSTASSRSSSSCCAFIETYSPAAIDTAPATRPAIPAVRTIDAVVPAPAMPRMSDTLDTSPSLTPNTVALAAPPVIARWCVSGWDGRSEHQRVTACRPRIDGSPVAFGRCPPAMTSHAQTLAERLSGLPRYRVDQVWQGLYEQLVGPEEMTTLPASLRTELADELPLALTPHRGIGERQGHDDQVALGSGGRGARRDRADALRGAGDRVRLVAGRLRDGLRLLRHRAGRVRSPPLDGGDRRAGRAG